MPKPKRGEVWLVRFPFTDLTTTKLRPALILAIHGEDIIVMGIFSRVSEGALHETWVLISERHPKFSQIGLKKDSLLKAEKIAVVHESILQRKLGVLPRDIMAQVEEALKARSSWFIVHGKVSYELRATSHQPSAMMSHQP